MSKSPGRLSNAMMAWLLRSPLHGVLSNNFMLITVTGRKSGRSITTPVNSVRAGDDRSTSSLAPGQHEQYSIYRARVVGRVFLPSWVMTIAPAR